MACPLATFQDAFARALLADDPRAETANEISALVAQPGFAIYRNTVMKCCIDALQANYPAVLRLVGEEWFRAAAAVFAREALPAQPSLLDYGEGFAAFLSAFEPAAELPYLADVARLDRLWSEAHVAADAPLLDAAAFAPLSPEAMSRRKLRLHPATRWLWRDRVPVHSIWRRNRAGDDDLGDIDWRGEGALLTRPRGEVVDGPLSAAGAALLDACARGATLHDSVTAAVDADVHADLAVLVDQMLRAGAFGRLEPVNDEESPS